MPNQGGRRRAGYRGRFIAAAWAWVIIAAAAGADDRSRVPYLIPRTVYVGDRAALVVPLAGENAAAERVIALDPRAFPPATDIELHRAQLEYRSSGSRLVVEFSAYAPGTLELPPIEIGGKRFAGLRVTISSVIGSGENGAVLAGPAPPLAVPGASFLIYGTMGAFVLFALFALWAGLWGRRRMAGWITRWKRGRLVVSMWGIEKRLRKNAAKEGSRRDLLNLLSVEFRGFLTFFTGENCRAMTAAEIGNMPAELFAPENGAAPELSGGFLEAFFRRCDELRFNGSDIVTEDVLAMLDDLRRFLKTLGRPGRGMSTGQGEAA
jgi:hypothetical protein